ncbi:hypothetical protein BJ742DRAFT_103755 [Cladochytrium replicatum]|nr:hypothetical protein BJ742DRAFT_103755 [Cladochytrium replicatum]
MLNFPPYFLRTLIAICGCLFQGAHSNAAPGSVRAAIIKSESLFAENSLHFLISECTSSKLRNGAKQSSIYSGQRL